MLDGMAFLCDLKGSQKPLLTKEQPGTHIMRIGMVGLGRMGANMVLRLIKAGHEVVVWDRSQDAVKDLAAKGAIAAADQKDLAAVFFKPQKAVGGRFDAAPFQLGALGLPILDDALGAVECELVGQVAAGDHTVFVGAVKNAVLHRDAAALELSATGWQYGG
jgi:flavin reductase (DIM6/NTAB) family NADH-FMN oxidoreductase RutF